MHSNAIRLLDVILHVHPTIIQSQLYKESESIKNYRISSYFQYVLRPKRHASMREK